MKKEKEIMENLVEKTKARLESENVLLTSEIIEKTIVAFSIASAEILTDSGIDVEYMAETIKNKMHGQREEKKWKKT